MQRLSTIFLALSLLFAVGVFVVMPKWTVDDAYISFRYGKNLVEAGALDWNPSEPGAVEGYTGVFLPLLAAAAIKLGLSPVLLSKLAGILGWLLMVLSFWRISRQMQISISASRVATGLICLYPFFLTHTLSSLETMMFIGVSMLFLERLYAFFLKPGMALALLLGGLLFLAGCIRPEGLIPGLAAILSLLIYRRRAKVQGKYLLAALLVFAVPATLYFLWRWQYYGHLFPNTFHAKAYHGLLNFDAISAWGRFLAKYFSIPLFALGFPVLLANKDLKIQQVLPQFRDAAPLRATALIYLVIYILFYLRVNLYMNYSYRFLVPVLPVIWVYFLPLIHLSLAETSKIQPKWKRFGGLPLWMVFGVVIALNLRDELYFTNYYKSIVEEELFPAGELLQERVPETEKIAVFMDVGAIGYQIPHFIVDFGGLNDVYLARFTASEEERINYFFKENPGGAVFTSTSKESYKYIPEAGKIQKDPRFSDYELIQKFGNSANFPYFQYVYVRRDLLQNPSGSRPETSVNE